MHHEQFNHQEALVPLIERRLFAVYDFAHRYLAEQTTRPVSKLLDVGTYNGFAQRHLSEIAQHVISFDIDKANISKARTNNDVARLTREQRLTLSVMDARHIGLASDIFDAATIIEVFGAGFDGDEQEVSDVFEDVTRTLKPGGHLIFTVKSRETDELLGGMEFGQQKGYLVSRSEIDQILTGKYTSIEWFGQLNATFTPYLTLPYQLHGSHLDISQQDLEPQRITDFEHQHPLFWIGVCQKAD